MKRVNAILAAGITAAAIGLGAALPAQAHGAGASAANQASGWHRGGQMGPMPGYGMGPGIMGPMMGYGMMGPGYGMGSGSGMGPRMMQPLRQDLTAADVKHMMAHRLAWNGNPDVKLGKVEEKDDDTIVAEIVTRDGSVVQSLEVDRHTGWMRSAQ